MSLSSSNTNDYFRNYLYYFGIGDQWDQKWRDRSLLGVNSYRNWEYYFDEGHFRNWIGTRPDNSTEEGKQITSAIQRMFQCLNIVREVIDHHVECLLSKDPSWFVMRGGEVVQDKETEETTKVVKKLMKKFKASTNEYFSDPLYAALTASLVEGVGYLRMTRLPEYIALESKDPWGAIAFHSPLSRSIDVMKRDGVGKPLKIKYFFERDGKTIEEVQELDIRTGLTHFTYKETGANKVDEEFSLDLNGQLTISEIRRRSVITIGVKAAQDAINHAATLIPHNNESSGFYSTMLLNARPPGRFETDDQGNRIFVPERESFVLAPGVINFVNGLATKDPNTGNITGYTQPTVHTDPPVPVDSFESSIKLFSAAIYRLVGQEYRLTTNTIMSQRSREELRADFQNTLEKDATRIVEPMLANFFMTSFLLGKRGTKLDKYQNLSLSIKMNIRVGLPSAEERKEVRESYSAGLLSKETAIANQSYTEDAEGEVDKIAMEKKGDRDNTSNNKNNGSGDSNGNGNNGSNQPIEVTESLTNVE